MFLVELLNKATSISELKKIYLSLAIIVSLLFSLTFYLNYEVLKNQKIQSAYQQEKNLNSAVKLTFNIYQEMLETISTRITTSNLEAKKISALLKQFHPSNENSSKIPFLDLTWHDQKHNLSVNRYGQTEGLLKLPEELESALKHSSGRNLFTTINDKRSLSGHQQLYILMRVLNAKHEHEGYLTALLDFENWIKMQSEQLNTEGLVLALIDNQNKILIASDSVLEEAPDISSADEYYQFIERINLPSSSSYYLMLGYNTKLFWAELITILIPQFAILTVVSLVSFTLFFLFRKKLENEQRCHFISDIENLKITNEQYKDEIASLKLEFDKEEILLKSKLKQSEGFLDAYKLSFKEKDNLLAEINSNISYSMKEIKELSNELHDYKSNKDGTRLTANEELSILSDIKAKIDSAAEFCVPNNDNAADIEEVAEVLANLYAKEIFKKNLNFSYEIKANTKTIRFNNLLFTQVMASLLYTSIDSAKPGGQIFIEASRKKSKEGDKLIILIKDDGFYLNEGELFDKSGPDSVTCSLRLSLNTVKTVLEKYNCYISTAYNKDGKTLELHFPCNAKAPKNTKANNFIGNNVIQFKKS